MSVGDIASFFMSIQEGKQEASMNQAVTTLNFALALKSILWVDFVTTVWHIPFIY
jgi:hypothetical protein